MVVGQAATVERVEAASAAVAAAMLQLGCKWQPRQVETAAAVAAAAAAAAGSPKALLLPPRLLRCYGASSLVAA